jgi:hypothetical protein
MSCGPYSCTITIDNRTGHHLKLLKHDLPWGKFQQGPEKDLMPGASKIAFVARENPGVPAGPEGTVWYQLGDDANKTTSIYFDVPTTPFKDNTVNVDTSDPYLSAVLSGFKGTVSDLRCTVRVVWAG